MNTDVHRRREPSWKAIFLELMNQDGHEIGEKQLLASSEDLPVEVEVSNGEKEWYDAKVIPMMANKVEHFGRRDSSFSSLRFLIFCDRGRF